MKTDPQRIELNKAPEPKRFSVVIRTVFCLILCLALGFTLFLGAISTLNWWLSPVRHLQAFASNIHDYTTTDFNLTGDNTRFIRAECSEADFHRFARLEGIATRLTEDYPKGLMSWPLCKEPWWTPPRSYRGTYYRYRDRGQCDILAYSNGHLYYAIIVW